MPQLPSREYRTALIVSALAAQQKRLDSDYYVEGYAALYDKYVLYDFGGGDVIYERFQPGCFNGADMSDVIMQYDHSGKVFARISNGSLLVEPDDKGLFMAADLSRTDAAKELYGEIGAEMITRMSWSFAPGDYYFDEAERCWEHCTVRKVYDVSAVSIPANNNTFINTRSADCSDGAIRAATEEFRTAQLDVRRRRLKLMTMTII